MNGDIFFPGWASEKGGSRKLLAARSHLSGTMAPWSQRRPSYRAAPAAPHGQPRTVRRGESYLGSLGEEKCNFGVVVVAGSLQRGLACLRKDTGRQVTKEERQV